MREGKEIPIQSIPGNKHVCEVHGKMYDVYRLIHEAKDLPVVHESVEVVFRSIVDGLYWNDANRKSIGPQDILNAIVRHDGKIDWEATGQAHPELTEHLQKIRAADFKHAILFSPERDLIDGVHRLTKAYVEGANTIPTKTFVAMPVSAIFTNNA